MWLEINGKENVWSPYLKMQRGLTGHRNIIENTDFMVHLNFYMLNNILEYGT